MNNVSGMNNLRNQGAQGVVSTIKSLGLGAYIWIAISLFASITTLWKFLFFNPESII